METLFQTAGGEQAANVVLLTEHGETEALAALFEGIAADLGWYPGNEIRSQPTALNLAVVVCGQLVGGLQAIPGDGCTALPYRRVWPEVETADRAVHVTVMALEKEYRGPGLFWPLCVELWRWCDVQGIETIFMEATPPTLRIYRRMGWPLEVVGELRQHWGEDCFLCRASVRQIEQAIVERAENSDAYRALVAQGHRDREVL